MLRTYVLLFLVFCGFVSNIQAQIREISIAYLNVQAEKLNVWEKELRHLNLSDLGLSNNIQTAYGSRNRQAIQLPQIQPSDEEDKLILALLEKSHRLYLQIENFIKAPRADFNSLQKAALFFEDIHILNQKIEHKLEGPFPGLVASKGEQKEAIFRRSLEIGQDLLKVYRYKGKKETGSILKSFQGISFPALASSESFMEDMRNLLARQIEKQASYNDKILPTFNLWVDQYNSWMQKRDPDMGLVRKLEPIFAPIRKSELRVINQKPEAQNLVFMIDISGSMEKQEKLPLVKQCFSEVLAELNPKDKIHILTFRDEARQILSNFSPNQKDGILGALDKLEAKGNTRPYTSFEIAYQIATQNKKEGKKTRMILITDGGFEIDPKKLPKLIEEHRYEGLSLSIMYTGNQESRVRNRLRKLAGIGNGQYIALNKENPAQKLLHLIRETSPVP